MPLPPMCPDGSMPRWARLAGAVEEAAWHELAGVDRSRDMERFVDVTCAPDLDGDGRGDTIYRFSRLHAGEPYRPSEWLGGAQSVVWALRSAAGGPLVELTSWSVGEGDGRPHMVEWVRGPDGPAVHFVARDAASNDGPDRTVNGVWFMREDLVVNVRAGRRRVVQDLREEHTGTDAEHTRMLRAPLPDVPE